MLHAVRTLLLLAPTLAGLSAATAPTPGPSAPPAPAAAPGPAAPAGPMSDEDVSHALDAVIHQLQALELTPDQRLDPRRVAGPTAQLTAVLRQAQHPTGAPAQEVRLVLAQLSALEEDIPAAERRYREVLAGPASDASLTAIGNLAGLLRERGDGDALAALVPIAQQLQMDPETLQTLQMMAQSEQAIRIGAPFPAVDVVDLAGTHHTVAQAKGRVLLIDTWATWCPPCVAMMPDVVAMYHDLHPRGLDIIGVSLDEDLGKLKQFITTHDVSWPQSCDLGGWHSAFAQRFLIHVVPETYVIGPDGVLRAKHLHGAPLRAAIERLLPPPAAPVAMPPHAR